MSKSVEALRDFEMNGERKKQVVARGIRADRGLTEGCEGAEVIRGSH